MLRSASILWTTNANTYNALSKHLWNAMLRYAMSNDAQDIQLSLIRFHAIVKPSQPQMFQKVAQPSKPLVAHLKKLPVPVGHSPGHSPGRIAGLVQAAAVGEQPEKPEL